MRDNTRLQHSSISFKYNVYHVVKHKGTHKKTRHHEQEIEKATINKLGSIIILYSGIIRGRIIKAIM